MSVTLYHYVHCPFCLRVRMTLGYLGIPYSSQVLSYDDEVTPVKLNGKKMLPLLVIDGKVQDESLDIMKLLDKTNRLQLDQFLSSQDYLDLTALLNRVGGHVHSLAMPYWIYTPEFNESSRVYFQKKKEEKRGPFNLLVQNQKKFIADIGPELKLIEAALKPYYQSSTLGPKDILIASHLWGLYVIPEFQFSENLHQYLQKVKDECHFNYHQDFWR